MDENLINVNQLRPFPRFLYTIGILPTSFKMSYTYEEGQIEIIKFIRDEIIPKVNKNALATKELQEKFVELVNYVETYLDNLDVQDEINNKLDEMAEDGTLEEIITAYLNIKALLCYTNVNNLKNAENIVEGSFLKTFGFYSLGDGGSAKYYVREIINTDVVDDVTIIGLTNYPNLIAELVIENDINVKQFGCKGDNVTDDGSNLQKAFSFANSLNKNVYFPQGQYVTTSKLYVNSDLKINGGNSEIISSSLDETIVLQGNSKLTIKDIKITTNSGIAIHVNSANVDNVILDNVTINSEGYGFLLNYNTANGSNLKIVNSNIKGKYDGIELNLTNETDVYNTIIISNNVVETKDTGTGSTSGFAIGISKGKRVIIDGNIIPYSRLEAIHVEAGTEETIISNNILHECDGEGIRLLPLNTVTRQTPKIVNNIIKGKDTSDYGIRCVNDTRGSWNELDLSNNLIENFNVGINIEQPALKYADLDGVIIKNCNQAIGGSPFRVIGKLKLINTPKLAVSTNSSFNYLTSQYDEVITDNLTDDFVTVASSQRIYIKKLLGTKAATVIDAGSSMRNMRIMKLPTYFKGTIKILSNNFNTKANILADVEIKNGELTSTNILTAHYGTISSSTLYLDSDGYLCYRCYAPTFTTGGTATLEFEFDGQLCFENYNVS